MSIRSFVAIPIANEQANALGDCSAKMAYQDKTNAVRWVDQANYHITLAFLGEQDESSLEVLADRLDDNLTEHSFQTTVSHLSPFPESKPKLIAALLEKNQQLYELQKKVVAAVRASSIEFEKRKFSPHITLGRYRHSKNHFSAGVPSTLDLTIDINEVTIFESILTPSGAEYEAMFRLPLDGFEDYEI